MPLLDKAYWIVPRACSTAVVNLFDKPCWRFLEHCSKEAAMLSRVSFSYPLSFLFGLQGVVALLHGRTDVV